MGRPSMRAGWSRSWSWAVVSHGRWGTGLEQVARCLGCQLRRQVRADLGGRRADLEVRAQRGLEPDVPAGLLGEQPLVLEDIAIRLDDVAVGPDHRSEAGRGRPEDLGQPAPGAFGPIDWPDFVPLEPAPVLAQVVHQDPGLALEGHQSRSPLELAGMEAAGGNGHPEPEPAAAPRLELDLIDCEAQVVQPPD